MPVTRLCANYTNCYLQSHKRPAWPDISKSSGNNPMTAPKPTTIDEYIAGLPEDVRAALQQVRATIRKAAPEATEAISYGIPTFKLNGENLVHFGGFKSHIGFYPTPTGIESFKEELSKYKEGKGSVQFPLEQAMPLDLIKRIVKYRVEQVPGKAAEKSTVKPTNAHK
jgi:uncharacterized protein YdhG (YjbR/CyaY superfamily)